MVLATLNIFNESFIGRFHNLQYLGLFIISFLTGAVAFIPIPGLILVFALGSVLFPPFIGLVSGLGEAAGNMLVYFTGYGGTAALNRLPDNYTEKFQGWLRKRGSLMVVLMSAMINPLFMPFTAVAGMMRYNMWKFFLLCFLGKTIKNTLIAYLGYLGLGSLLRLIGVPV